MKKIFTGYENNDKNFLRNALYQIVDIDRIVLDKDHYPNPQKFKVTVIVDKIDVIKRRGKKQ
jgi:hypothetical protein